MQYDYEKFFHNSLDILVIARMDNGHVIHVNPSFERIFGWSEKRLLGLGSYEFLHPEDLPSTQEIAAKLATGSPVVSFENRYRSIDGNYRTLSWTAVPEYKSGMVYAIARDITEAIESNRKISELATELKEANNMLLEQASTDPLTKLKNRRAFNAELNRLLQIAQKHSNPISLLMIDADHFKDYNDKFGHPAGDQVLIDLAFLLTHTLRQHDVIARYGGEEFIVAMPDTSEVASLQIAERLIHVVGEFNWEKRPVTISIGAATLPGEKQKTSLEENRHFINLIESADKALYHSKINGRNQVNHSSRILPCKEA
ncbi:sensor domain-containing diguanylate cyclase [Leptospira interrogans]|uniref:diguanylate cyclase n=2 Tax=Leptospira interrogans TaxID=173 RepID=A0A0F6IJT2_LEPIR|nr:MULTISPECIES: sensor domain-containing diguanylate cyclase [Leptospira]AJR15104.1 GGDEF family protein [Leptospira interrogans serovar Linhai str. 56609]EJO80616.1 diguanylate cyclase (GGDEF) domain protein [Leptospira interrogans serovar Pomona str. Kennewicki LC82-25]EKN99343.1 diguanylate cyclase (GGDEF) domain protein [Leptospira interrogans serovar Pomona str. Pomona]EKR34799.1 diguanylate cyclase (GGDEF) domain protein [Leptospira interrogans serovar Hebdomadis str. R499]EKR80711.1 di